MPRRSILTKRQQTRLLDLPTDAASLHDHYTLDDFDLEQIRQRRRPHNKMGFALQLCALRYPGRLLAPGETIPIEVLRFLAAQIGIEAGDLAGYASREETRHNHLAQLRDLYGFKSFTGRGAAELRQWLLDQAFHATSNLDLMNVLLAEGLNLGLRKMAEASNSHGYWQLQRISQWHIVSDSINRALAMIIEAQSDLPMAHLWGLGETASSDGQFFPTTRQGEAMNLINAKYGNDPGIKAYTHVSDQFGPFVSQKIPATVNEAPFILDGLLTTDTGRKIKEQYADTGGFTDHTFALTSLLGYQFVPRIRDLPSKRLFLFDPAAAPKNLRSLIGGKVRENLIRDHWEGILRIAVTMDTGAMQPSQIMRKLASYPRQNALAVALREVGRIERTLFIARWLTDSELQRRTQIGLNKGEAHHALKNALRIGRQGEIRDRSSRAQDDRLAGLNLLAAIIIYWNTKQLGQIIAKRRRAGIYDPESLLSHVSPLGWAHILITGEYRWPKITPKIP